MKHVHNVRARLHEREAEAIGKLFNQLMRDAGLTHEDVEVRINYDGEADLHVGELWADRQQPVRRLLGVLVQELPEHQRRDIAEQPTRFLDTGTHCYLRLDKGALGEGTYTLVPEGECLHVRLNIAAYPATRENASRVLAELFST